MIRINVLPRELRKRQGGGFNKEVLLLAAGLLLTAGFAAGWYWLRYERLPYVEEELLTASEEAYFEARDAADEVRAIERQITAYRTRLDQLNALMARKMHHAELINAFADLLAEQQWSVPGFSIACLRLSIQEEQAGGRRRAGGGDEPRFTFNWELELVGHRFERAGDYIAAFFDDVRTSDFWIRYGFLGEPVAPYRGDTPTWNEDLERVVVTHPLTWIRDQAEQAENRALLEERAAGAEDATASAGDPRLGTGGS